MTTHKPKPPEDAFGTVDFGVSDVLRAVDTRSKAVMAAEEFAACECRCQVLWGQYIAECDRLIELSKHLDEAVKQSIKEAVR